LNSFADRLGRLALVAVTAAAVLGLAACGRKGNLDPPPNASLTEPATPRPSLGEDSDSLAPQPPPRAAPASNSPPAPPKSFFLDFLIGK